MAPTYSRNTLSISLLTGVQDAVLEAGEIRGHWSDEPREVRSKYSTKTLAEQFANWASDPESILRFVQRYGPLAKWQPGEFHQSLEQWRKRQAEVRALWQGPSLGYKIGLREGEMLAIGRKELVLQVDDLSRFLEFEIFSHPAARRRRCARPDCENPFFIARHLKTKTCSEVCKAWMQRQHQLNWWAERGAKWRAERKGVEKRKKKRGEQR